MDKTLEEKIKLSEELVDKYLNELDANIVQTGLNAINTAKGLAYDATAVYKAYKAKQEEKKRQMMLAKQQKEKQQMTQNKNIA